MWKALLVLSLIFAVGSFGAEDTTPQNISPSGEPQAAYPSSSPKPGVKQGLAAGKAYHGKDDYDHGYGNKVFRGYDVPLIDDYICDLDATILVVTNSDTANTYDQDKAYVAPEKDAGYAPANDGGYGRVKRDASYGMPSYEPREAYDRPSKGYDHPRAYGGRDSYEGRESYGRERHHQRDYAPKDYGKKHDYDSHEYGQDQGHHYLSYSSGVSANADRLRCGVIAAADEESCTTCCRLSARRDRSISKHKIIGFLVDHNQLNYDSQSGGEGGYGDGYAARRKRSDDYASSNAGAPTYNQESAYSGPTAEVPIAEGDYRCVCCAPKRYRPFSFDRFVRPRHGYGDGPY